MFFGDSAYQVIDTIHPSELSSESAYIGLEHIEQETLQLIGIGNPTKVTSNKRIFRKGDILFGKLRPYFRKVIFADFDGICSTDIWVIRPKENIDSKFLYYWCANWKFINFVNSASEGTRMPRAKWEVAINHEIPNHTYEHQKIIGNILGSLDEKIKHNKKNNETLEEITKAIFKSWFIDFDPVRAKSECLSTGLNNEISDSFPDSFEVSHLGEIPEGWKIHKLGDFIDIKGGLSYESQFIGSGKNLITMGCISPNKKFNFSGLKKYSGDFKESNLLRHKDIVISTRDVTQDRVTLGAPAMVPKILDGSIVATNLYKVIFINKTLSCYFLFESLKSKRYRENIIASAKGSTVLMLTRDSVLDYEIIVPKDDLMKKFHNLYETMQRRYEIINNEIETLVELRDQLLPKLISGELRIPDAEKIIEEVGI